jgi:hypothetical protein
MDDRSYDVKRRLVEPVNSESSAVPNGKLTCSKYVLS